jgi:hypothetical protein
MVQHVFAEIALTAVGARVGVAALDVAIFPARNIFRRAYHNIVGAAERIVVIAGCIDHGRLSALKAAREQRCDEQKGDAEFRRPEPHSNFPSMFRSSLPGLTRQSIEIKAFLEE